MHAVKLNGKRESKIIKDIHIKAGYLRDGFYKDKR